MGEETTIMGTVLSVVFQNEENGYAVLRLVTDDGELLTLVGCVPCAAPGENLTATGSFSSHPQYGEQFSASEVERYLPSNETEILNYLASGVVRGVGPATAEKLVARFGIDGLCKHVELSNRHAAIFRAKWRCHHHGAGILPFFGFASLFHFVVGLQCRTRRCQHSHGDQRHHHQLLNHCFLLNSGLKNAVANDRSTSDIEHLRSSQRITTATP